MPPGRVLAHLCLGEIFGFLATERVVLLGGFTNLETAVLERRTFLAISRTDKPILAYARTAPFSLDVNLRQPIAVAV